jgi:hypothetical protein
MFAALQHAIGADVLMVRISLPLCRFAAARYDNTRAMSHSSRLCLDCRCQVHRECYRADNAVSVMHQLYELSQRCLPDEADDTF